jgi:hypothetical protein
LPLWLTERKFELQSRIPDSAFGPIGLIREGSSRLGTLRISDPQSATTQFLGMVSNFAFWPRLLLPNWSPSKPALRKAVDEAVETMLARYSVSGPGSG